MRNVKHIIIILTACFGLIGCGGMKIDIKIIKHQRPCVHDNLEAWLDTLCSKTFAGRKTASVGDSLAYEFISNNVRKLRYDLKVQEFNTTNGYRLRNIIVSIDGEIDSSIVIGAHYDAPVESASGLHYPAANDNASGVITLLGFLDSLKASGIKPKHSLLCCFWDGEEVFDGSCFWGSTHFVKSISDKSIIKCYLNFDSVGHEHELYLRHRGYVLVPEILETLHSNSLFRYVDVDMNATGGGGSDYVPFSNAGISYISFGDHNGTMCNYNSHSTNDLPEAISYDRILRHISNLFNMASL